MLPAPYTDCSVHLHAARLNGHPGDQHHGHKSGGSSIANMARGKGPKFYAVAVGVGGPRIYEEWSEAEQAVTGFKGGKHKSFTTEREAKEWIAQNHHAVGVTVQQCLDDFRFTRAPPTLNGSQSNTMNAAPAFATLLHPSSTPEYRPRLTTRYTPYPNCSSRPGGSAPSSSRGSAHGVPSINPPRSSGSVQPSSSQADPIPISSDAEDEAKAIVEARRKASLKAGAMLNGYQRPSNVSDSASRRQEQKNFGQPATSDMAGQWQPPATTPGGDVKASVVVTPAPGEPVLSEEQLAVLERVIRGESIFFTGSAGVGKSVLTRAIIKALGAIFPHPQEVAVTATTGIAATNIGGCTLHSWAGVGLAKLPVDRLYGALMRPAKGDVLSRWRMCKALIIDEVSMLHGSFFDKLEEIARMVRNNSLPFGGIQLVVTGDFFQLPPVQEFAPPGQQQHQVKFAFESKGWKAAIPKMVVLKQVFRQRNDTFVRLLNELRMGRASQEAIDTFKGLSRKVTYEDGVEPTCLYARRNQVLYENTRRLKQLQGVNVTYRASDVSGKSGEAPNKDLYPQEKDLRPFLDKHVLVENTIDLKVGAQVMLVKNLQTGGLVNGSIGRIIGFANAGQIKEAAMPQLHGYRSEAPAFPDIDANHAEDEYADAAEQEWLAQHGHLSDVKMQQPVDVKPRASGTAPDRPAQAPTSTSSVQSTAPPLPPSLYDIKIAAAALTEKEKQQLWTKRRAESGYDIDPEELMEEPALPGTWPVVEFTKGGQKMLLPPMDFTVDNANGKVEARRTQIPLILAWALSIHKSQGQTLERVKVDLGEIFETGQAYVALSRATQMETLQVMRFYPNKVKAHPKVSKWYEQIANSRDL